MSRPLKPITAPGTTRIAGMKSSGAGARTTVAARPTRPPAVLLKRVHYVRAMEIDARPDVA